jgi:hypothetical protein
LGRNLRPEHLAFFRNRMNEHTCVARWEPLDNEYEYLYRIIRERGLPDVRVHLTDAYQYSRAEYLARPGEVMQRNSFIVLALPHAYDATSVLIAEARTDGIGIGKIGKFMGALNSRDVSTYETPEERREREETEKRWQ